MLSSQPLLLPWGVRSPLSIGFRGEGEGEGVGLTISAVFIRPLYMA